MGLGAALPIFAEIRESTGLPTLTDVHETAHCAAVAEVVDVLQIPAFLCRQTDLIVAAAKTGAVLNIKKGQFLSPWEMQNSARAAWIDNQPAPAPHSCNTGAKLQSHASGPASGEGKSSCV